MADSPWKSFPTYVPDDAQEVDVRRLGFIPDAPIFCIWSESTLTFNVKQSPLDVLEATIPWYMVIEWAPHI